MVARAGPAVTAACSEFARTLGTAFQIVDDVQNFGPIQKKRGEDLSGKHMADPGGAPGWPRSSARPNCARRRTAAPKASP
ncbi:MAG: polyprenyl synthetase family protein [Betaproteobacteria bacterium]|nr:polyprenyl synthetase family protein [Betaproteobacteria bacterium]